jgi:hypothetical protein
MVALPPLTTPYGVPFFLPPATWTYVPPAGGATLALATFPGNVNVDGALQANQVIANLFSTIDLSVINTLTVGGVSQFNGPVNCAGALTVAGAAQFNGATQFQSGTFVPGLTFNNVPATLTGANGWYTKIGNRVFYNLIFDVAAKGAGVGPASIQGLPFPSNAAANNYAAQTLSWGASPPNIAGWPSAYMGPGRTFISLVRHIAGVTTALTDADFVVNTELEASGHYWV